MISDGSCPLIPASSRVTHEKAFCAQAVGGGGNAVIEQWHVMCPLMSEAGRGHDSVLCLQDLRRPPIISLVPRRP